MKQEEVKIRITPTLKKDFQDICENEETTMSNKINNFIFNEVKMKKIKNGENRVFTKQLIKFDIMNRNNRLYQKNQLTNIKLDENGFEYNELDRLNNEIIYGQFGHIDSGEKIHKYNATHSINNLKITEDWLEGDITILNDSIIPIFDNLVFRPRAFGIVDENGVIQNLEIISFDAILKSEDKFIE